MTYFWRISDDYPESLIGEYDRSTSPDRFEFQKGCTLSADLGTPVFRFSAKKEEFLRYDDLANNAMVPLISEKFASLLVEAASEDIQLFDTVVSAVDGEVNGYKLVNVTKKVDAVDREASSFSLVPGTDIIMGFTKITLIDDPLKGLKIARLGEQMSYVLIAESIKKIIIDNGIKRVGLYSAHELSF